ncbi:hypothetical protein [Methanoregula sp.]|uniref:hypothetical protein n=1 Tax=Methanoregula sp. TaxID=2052170 RepID=UPI002C2686CA|nr:hypothetical protein [Methanoregula sp.]HVP97307.1 hypothetical protein [Methanoregula sp.]
MRIVKSVQTKVCVDGSLMKEYILDEPLTPAFLAFLRSFGTVKEYPHMKRPYFSFEQEYFISIKGFAGDTSVEVRYRKESIDLISDYFHLLLFYSRDGEQGIRKMHGITDSIRERMNIRQPKG